MIKVVLVDDHALVSEGIKRIITSDTNYAVIAQLLNGREVIEFARHNETDIIIMDINMPEINGIEATSAIKKLKPQIKIIILSMLSDFVTVNKIFECGADGYLIKNISDVQLFEALTSVMEGKIFISPEIQQVLLHGIREQKNQPHLTQKEKEVLRYIAEGWSNKKIASELFLSEETIRSHRKNIMNKFDLHSTAELVKFALKKINE